MITPADWQSLYTQQLAATLNARFGDSTVAPKQVLQNFIQDVLNEAMEDKILSQAADKAETDPRNSGTTVSHQDAWATYCHVQ